METKNKTLNIMAKFYLSQILSIVSKIINDEKYSEDGANALIKMVANFKGSISSNLIWSEKSSNLSSQILTYLRKCDDSTLGTALYISVNENTNHLKVWKYFIDSLVDKGFVDWINYPTATEHEEIIVKVLLEQWLKDKKAIKAMLEEIKSWN